MTITKDIIKDSSTCATHKKIKELKSITLHWIGPYPHHTPAGVKDWWENGGGEASAHYIIKDDECLQCWENDDVAWHCGNKEGNESSIGIEIIPANEKGMFSKESIATLKALLATLPKVPLKRHYDWSGKDCPKYYCDAQQWFDLQQELGSPAK